MRITAVIITRNAEQTIRNCLQSVQFCDEVIVVDSDSEDGTERISKELATKCVTRSWSGFSDQKNYANSLATYDWILSVDADEVVPEELKQEILQTLKGGALGAAYAMNRKTFFSGHWIRYGGWYPNTVTRLFDRRFGKWTEVAVHECWKTDGSTFKLNSDLHHFSFAGIFDQVERNNLYSSLGSVQLRTTRKAFSVIPLLLKPPAKFFEAYVVKRGFLDGYWGFIIAVSAAYSVFLKWAKLWEAGQNEKAI